MYRDAQPRLLYLFLIALNTVVAVVRIERDLLEDGGSVGGQLATRHRRAPAIWGEPAPDYSAVRLFGEPVYLYALLFVDRKISEHYGGDTVRLKSEVMRLAKEANRYFYQVAIRLVVVDVIETMRNDLTLFTFEQMRDRNIRELPYHNFAAIVSYRHAGGLAFVSGMCSTKSVMLTGFYPHNPEAMGSIFFHEVAHLIGVPHSAANETLNVLECGCEPTADDSARQTPLMLASTPGGQRLVVERNDDAARPTRQPLTASGCLRIPGFDHDCTLQWMANLVQRNRCLRRQPLSHSSASEILVDGTDNADVLYRRGQPANVGALRAVLDALPLCGNGALERGEQCDCGLPQMCTAWNCDPTTCTRVVPLWIVYLCTAVLIVSLMAPLVAYVHLRRRYHNSKDFCWAQAAACYARLPRGVTLPRRLCGMRYWRQDGGDKWAAKSASGAQCGFLRRRLSAGALASDAHAPKRPANTPSVVEYANYSSRFSRTITSWLDAIRSAWPSQSVGGASGGNRATIKLMRLFASSARRDSTGRPPSASVPYVPPPTPKCAWSNVWPPPAPPLFVLSRPRVPPPPPPSGERNYSSIIVIQPPSNKRPARPPPPRPPSSALSSATYFTRSAAQRLLLPPPPPPPPAVAKMLPRPPAFSPPDVPYEVRAGASVTPSAAYVSAKLAPPSILSAPEASSSIALAAAPSLLKQIEADAARQFANRITVAGDSTVLVMSTIACNDADEDRYSISQKFADFEEDDPNFQSDCDEKSFSAAG